MLDLRLETQRIEATRRRLADGTVAGFVATVVMTGLFFFAPSLAGPRGVHAAARAIGELRAHAGWLVLAVAAHFVYGALAGGLFTASARAVTIGRAVGFSLALWAVALTVYAPVVGLGFAAGRTPGLALLALPAHVAYGVALGALAPRGGEILHPIGA